MSAVKAIANPFHKLKGNLHNVVNPAFGKPMPNATRRAASPANNTVVVRNPAGLELFAEAWRQREGRPMHGKYNVVGKNVLPKLRRTRRNRKANRRTRKNRSRRN